MLAGSISGRHRDYFIISCSIHLPIIYVHIFFHTVGDWHKYLLLVQSVYNSANAEPCVLSATLVSAFRNSTASNCVHTLCTCMHGWEQLHRVWPEAKHNPPRVVAHREDPEQGGLCIVFVEPFDHEEWTGPREPSDVLTGNLPPNGRRAKTKTETYQIDFLYLNIRFRQTFFSYCVSEVNAEQQQQQQ